LIIGVKMSEIKEINNNLAIFIILLPFIFIILKIIGYIKWNWFWVIISPIWVSFLMFCAMLFVVYLFN